MAGEEKFRVATAPLVLSWRDDDCGGEAERIEEGVLSTTPGLSAGPTKGEEAAPWERVFALLRLSLGSFSIIPGSP